MIPKIIYQCGPWEESKIPEYVLKYSATWRNLKGNWDYKYFDDNMCAETIEMMYGSELSNIYQKIDRGDNRADLWRCLHIFYNGGFYADLDSKYLIDSPMDLNLAKKFIALRNSYPETGEIWENWFFGAEKNSIVLEQIISEIKYRIKVSNTAINAHHTFFPFSIVANEFCNEKWFLDITRISKNVIGHIAANKNWNNEKYFANGGPEYV